MILTSGVVKELFMNSVTEQILEPGPMTMSDIQDVLEIERSSFPAPWSKQMFLDEMSNSNARLIVFKLHGSLVAYMCFWQVLDEAHLMNIAVHPAHRGKGYGKILMDHLDKICRDGGVKRIILEVARRNIVARNLYKKCGFSSIGFRRKYYAAVQDDAIVMQKLLLSEENQDEPAEKIESS